MPDSDLYVGLAGVAVVFAGFAGISIVLTGRQPEDWRYVDAGRLTAMILLSFVTAFFSLLPLVVAHFVASGELLWRICSALFLVLVAAPAPFRSYFLMRRAYRAPDADRGSALSIALFYVVQILVVLVLAATTFAIGPVRGEGFYLVALICYLGMAARMFIRTLAVLRTAESE